MTKLLGQQIGAFPYVRAALRVPGLEVIDGTAGDGADHDSSPQLIKRHLSKLAQTVKVAAHLIERNPSTAQLLVSNLSPYPDYLEVHQGDARQIVPTLMRRGWAVTYIDDPNHAGDSTLVPSVVDWLTEQHAWTLLATIGANANGIARKDGHYEECLSRYLHVLGHARRERGYRRAAAFVTLSGDSHRWSYLIIGSNRFEEDSIRWFSRCMGQVLIQEGGRTRRLQGEISRGFAPVEEALIRQHTRRKPRSDSRQEPLL